MDKKLEDTFEDVKKKMALLHVKVDGTAIYDRTHGHSELGRTDVATNAPSNAAVLSLTIPRELFLLWDKYITLCKALNKTPDSLTAEINERVMGTSLNCKSTTLNKRITTEFSRFITKYKRMGGAKRKVEATKHTNIIVFKNELQQLEKSTLKLFSLSKTLHASNTLITLASYV